MRKTSIYLEPELDLRLTRIASQSGQTKAKIIRDSLWQTAQKISPARIEAIGVGSGPGDVSARVDDYLKDALGPLDEPSRS